MPPSKGPAPSEAPAEELPQPTYPAIESFIERASREDVGTLFTDLKAEVGRLKGPKAPHGKKINGAIARAEELLTHLVGIREKLEADSQGPKGRK